MNFLIKNTEYNIKFSFLVFNAIIFLLKDSKIIMDFYAVCLIHEIGHLIAIKITGGKIESVVFSGTGVIITPIKNPKYELFIMLAGVSANLIVYFILSICGVSGTFHTLNLITAIYNILPYKQLDGGASLCILIEGTPNERIANIILTIIKIIFSLLLLISVFYNQEFFPLFIVSIMLFISEREFL